MGLVPEQLHRKNRLEKVLARSFPDDLIVQADALYDRILGDLLGRMTEGGTPTGREKCSTLYVTHYLTALDHKDESGIHLHLGVLHGGSLVIAAKAIEAACAIHTVVGIDVFDGQYHLPGRIGGDPDSEVSGVPVTDGIVRTNLSAFEVENTVLVKGWTHEDHTWEFLNSTNGHVAPPVPVWVVYMSASHDLQGLEAEWGRVSPAMPEGAFALVADCGHEDLPEVTMFTHGSMTGARPIGHIGRHCLHILGTVAPEPSIPAVTPKVSTTRARRPRGGSKA